MATLSGLLTEVIVVEAGSTATAAAAAGATTIVVDNPTDYTDGAVLSLDGGNTAYTLVGDGSDDGTLTITPPLAVAVAEGDPVRIMVAGQIASDVLALVELGTADDPGDTIRVPITYDQAAAFPEGQYDPPLPVTLTSDLSRIVDVSSLPGPTFATPDDLAAVGLNRITKATTAPVGSGVTVGDEWRQYADGTYQSLIAQWTWDGTTWQQTFIAYEVLAQVLQGKDIQTADPASSQQWMRMRDDGSGGILEYQSQGIEGAVDPGGYAVANTGATWITEYAQLLLQGPNSAGDATSAMIRLLRFATVRSNPGSGSNPAVYPYGQTNALALIGDLIALVGAVSIGGGRAVKAKDSGHFTGTSDASGQVTVPHVLGVTPTVVIAQPDAGERPYDLFNIRTSNTATGLVFQLVDPSTNTAPGAGATASFSWMAEA